MTQQIRGKNEVTNANEDVTVAIDGERGNIVVGGGRTSGHLVCRELTLYVLEQSDRITALEEATNE